jgi:hypothetical protein
MHQLVNRIFVGSSTNIYKGVRCELVDDFTKSKVTLAAVCGFEHAQKIGCIIVHVATIP